MRAAWWAAELYNNFGDKLDEVVLRPGETGSFEVKYNGDLLYSMLAMGEHAEFNAIRDIIAGRLEQSS